MGRRQAKLLALLLLLLLTAFAVLRSLSARSSPLLHQHARADRRTVPLEPDARDARSFTVSAQQDVLVDNTAGSPHYSDFTAGSSAVEDGFRISTPSPPHRTHTAPDSGHPQDASSLHTDSFHKTGFQLPPTQLPGPTFPQEQTKLLQDWTTLVPDQTMKFPQDRSEDFFLGNEPDSMIKPNAADSLALKETPHISDDLSPGSEDHGRQSGAVRHASDRARSRDRASPNHPTLTPRLASPHSAKAWFQKTGSGWTASRSEGDVPEKTQHGRKLPRQPYPHSQDSTLPPSSLSRSDAGLDRTVHRLHQSEQAQTPSPPASAAKRQTRGYLVYLCEGEGERCGGWADRQRGMLSVFLLAVVTDRIFKVDMRTPCNLTNFLQPAAAGGDWWRRGEGEEGLEGGGLEGGGVEGGGLEGGGVAVVNDMGRRPVLPGVLQRGTGFNARFPQGTVYVQTNRDLAPVLAHSPLYSSRLPAWARHPSQATRFRLGWPLLVTPTPSITRKLSTLLLPLTRVDDAGQPVTGLYYQSVPGGVPERTGGDGGGVPERTGGDGGGDGEKTRADSSMLKLTSVPSSADDGQNSPQAIRNHPNTLTGGQSFEPGDHGHDLNRLTNTPDPQTGDNGHPDSRLINKSPNVPTGSPASDFNPPRTLPGSNQHTNTSRNTADTKLPLVCAHLRMGRNPDMPEDTGVWNDATSVQMAFTFLQSLLSMHGGFVFIATDDQGVRVAARNWFQTRLLDHGGTIVHVDRQRALLHACAGFETAILDQLILSRCDVLVMSQSGFSRHAAYLRHQQQQGLFLLSEGMIEPYTFPSE